MRDRTEIKKVVCVILSPGKEMDAEEIHQEIRKTKPNLLYRERINGHRGLAKVMQQFEEIQKKEKCGRLIYKQAR